jgi:hypothetical protein
MRPQGPDAADARYYRGNSAQKVRPPDSDDSGKEPDSCDSELDFKSENQQGEPGLQRCLAGVSATEPGGLLGRNNP